MKFPPRSSAPTKVYTFSRRSGQGSHVARVQREILVMEFQLRHKKFRTQFWSFLVVFALILTFWLPASRKYAWKYAWLFLAIVTVSISMLFFESPIKRMKKSIYKSSRKTPRKTPRKKRRGYRKGSSRGTPSNYSRSPGPYTSCRSREFCHSQCSCRRRGSSASSLSSSISPTPASSRSRTISEITKKTSPPRSRSTSQNVPTIFSADVVRHSLPNSADRTSLLQSAPLPSNLRSPQHSIVEGEPLPMTNESSTLSEHTGVQGKQPSALDAPSPSVSTPREDSFCEAPVDSVAQPNPQSCMFNYPDLMERHNLTLYNAKVQVINHRIMPGSYVNYRIHVALKDKEGLEWDIWHRYSEVMTLHLAVKKELSLLKQKLNCYAPILLPRTPPRSFRRKITDAIISQRMQLIGELLSDLVNQQPLCDLDPVREFLGALPLPPSLKYSSLGSLSPSAPSTPIHVRKRSISFEARPSSAIRFLDEIMNKTSEFLSPAPRSVSRDSVISYRRSSHTSPDVKNNELLYGNAAKSLTSSRAVSPTGNRSLSLDCVRFPMDIPPLDMSAAQVFEPLAREDLFDDINPSIFDSFSDSGQIQTFKIRGETYLDDKIKVLAMPALFELLHADVFEVPREVGRIDHISATEMGKRQIERITSFYNYDFLFVINYQIPGNPLLNMVTYHGVPSSFLEEISPDKYVSRSQKLFKRYLQLPSSPDPDDDGKFDLSEFQNSRFKLVPAIVDGPWVCKKAVVNKPAILGQKITQRYFKAEQYIETDLDIASSLIADKIVSLCRGYAINLVVDVGITLEGQCQEELPEILLSSTRLKNLDLTNATPLFPDYDTSNEDEEEEEESDNDC